MNSAQLADLHLRCFGSHPRPWSAAEIDDLLSSRLNFLLHQPQGFLIGRSIADEAELLTVAVSPDCRRQGIGRSLLADFRETARMRGATTAFLEVASDNPGARALYLRDGWDEVGLRRNYYAPGIDALLMPRMGGSWPGSLFTAAPLRLPAGHFGLGYGDRAHAPDEFCLIESKNPKLHGMNDMVRSCVDYLYALA